jgi:catechol 2,3-dioxygenase-like lactoylglutathione lyase family enzyme
MTPEPDVIALRPFVPTKDFDVSLRFYTDLGFVPRPLGDKMASLHLGPFAFLLQNFDAPGFSDNFMMHLLVHDVNGWWARIAALDLPARYGVRPPQPPKLQPWGLTVAFVTDPTGVLWHIAQRPDHPNP